MAKFSELSDRYDPDMVLFRRKIHGFRHPVERMHKFFSTSPQYGANEKGVERETSEEPRYVRITDINEYGLLSEELGATAETIEPQYLLQENDLLFARSGNTVGCRLFHAKRLGDGRGHLRVSCYWILSWRSLRERSRGRKTGTGFRQPLERPTSRQGATPASLL